MTKKELLELFRITSEKIAAMEEETRRKIADWEAKIAALRTEREQISKGIEQKLDRLTSQFGSYTKAVANIAEEYFYRALKKHPSLHNIHFDKVLKNKIYDNKEYDIIMINELYLAVVSIKKTLRKNHLIKLRNKDLPDFRKFCNDYIPYQKCQLIGVGAGLSYEKEVLAMANDLDILVLTQSGDHEVTLLNEEIIARIF